jgi:hypothetical protein
MRKSRVILLKTRPETIHEDYQKLFELVELNSGLDSSQPTILKDNISWHLHFPSANTTPWQLDETIKALEINHFNNIIALHNNTVVNDPDRGIKNNRLKNIFERHKIQAYYNFRPEVNWIFYQPKRELLILPKIYPDGIKLPELMFGANIIHLPTVKAHIYTTTTGAIKNAFGGLLNNRRHYTHTWIHETLVDLLTIQQEIHSGILAIMDGTTCGNGPGPRTMIPVNKGIILASFDQVAIDAIAAYLMGFNPMEIKYLRLAQERGLGCGLIDEIEIVGNPELIKSRWNFHVGTNPNQIAAKMFWFGRWKKIQHFLFHTPIVYLFIVASYVYHDFIWYGLIGRFRRKKWLKTDWGKLFLSYSK